MDATKARKTRNGRVREGRDSFHSDSWFRGFLSRDSGGSQPLTFRLFPAIMYVGVDMTETTKHHDSDAQRQEKKRAQRKSIGSILSSLDFGTPQLLVPVPVNAPAERRFRRDRRDT